MKKKSLNKKGFAMAELLAIAIVILYIFSVLVSNYLPLVAEFENRVNYTNITANYAAFQVRKVYKSVLESPTIVVPGDPGKDFASYIKDNLGTTGPKAYIPLYDKSYASENIVPNFVVNKRQQKKLNSVIQEYGIEEIILTTYKLNDVKKTTKADFLADKKGLVDLYGFIQYLPNYDNTRFYIDTKNAYEPYRLIIKTKDYGYATTQILPDPPTSFECFELSWVTTEGVSGFKVTKYNSTKEECKDTNIVIGTNKTIRNGKEGRIVAIGDNVFKDMQINSISLSEGVREIGANAFNGSQLTKFSFAVNGPSVTKVGANAFANNKFTSIEIPSLVRFDDNTNSKVSYGSGAFAYNYSLKNITFLTGSDSMNISDNMFILDPNNDSYSKTSEINVNIPSYIKGIGNSAFANVKVKSLSFSDDSNLTTIGESAFTNTHLTTVSLPNSVETISKNAFKDNSSLTTLTLSNKLSSIGESAFENTKVASVTLPSSLSKISASAFADTSITSINIPSNTSDLGSNIFHNTTVGDSYSDSSKMLKIENKSLFTNSELWCNVLFGKSENCTFKEIVFGKRITVDGEERYMTEAEKQAKLDECPDKWEELEYESEKACTDDISSWKIISSENEKYKNYIIYECTYNSKNKYVTYIKGGD